MNLPEFSITLKSTPSSFQPPDSPLCRMKKILIIEDDPIVAHIYRTRVEKEGYEVEVANDGQAGFYRIHEFHPDAVLLDLMLPKMNGVDILKKIRAQGQFSKIPIIVFTNAYVPNMIHESFGAGATQVFNKATLTPRQILDALHNAIYPTIGLGAGQPTPAAEPPPQAPPEKSTGSARSIGQHPYHPSPAPAPRTFPSGSGGPPVLTGKASQQSDTAFLTAAALDTSRDQEFQSELLTAFMQSGPETLNALRKALQDFTKTQPESSRPPSLLELYRRVHALTGSAGIAGFPNIAQMAAALEVLLKELYEKPKNINASTLRP